MPSNETAKSIFYNFGVMKLLKIADNQSHLMGTFVSFGVSDVEINKGWDSVGGKVNKDLIFSKNIIN